MVGLGHTHAKSVVHVGAESLEETGDALLVPYPQDETLDGLLLLLAEAGSFILRCLNPCLDADNESDVSPEDSVETLPGPLTYPKGIRDWMDMVQHHTDADTTRTHVLLATPPRAPANAFPNGVSVSVLRASASERAAMMNDGNGQATSAVPISTICFVPQRDM